MKILKKVNNLKRAGNIFLAVLLVFSASGYFFQGRASAAQLTTRSIKMSSSNPGQTKVQYVVKFNPGQNASVGGVVIDFCQQDPIPSDTCGAISGFSTSYGANLTAGSASLSGASGFTLDTASGTVNTGTNTIIMSNATAQAFTTGGQITITLGDGSTTGLTNPTTANSTFYARILTYPTKAAADAYSSTSTGSPLDTGGIALSTASQLTITAKVQETLSFCIYNTASCAGGVTALNGQLGNNGILDASNAYTNANGKFQASTNASQGVNIYAYGPTLTATSSGYTIAAIGSTAAASNPGNEQFGFCIATSGGSVSAQTPYGGNSTGGTSGSTCNQVTTGQGQDKGAYFAMDTTAMSGTGSLIANSTGPSTTTTGTIAYIANISPTTKAGSYSATHTFVAVGTF